MTELELMRYRDLQAEIMQLEGELDRLVLSTMPKSSLSGMPKSTPQSPDKIGEIMDKKIHLQEIIAKKHGDLIALREKIERAIEGLEPRERTLLRYHYIDGLNFDKCSEKMHYSRKTIYLIHKEAMRKL